MQDWSVCCPACSWQSLKGRISVFFFCFQIALPQLGSHSQESNGTKGGEFAWQVHVSSASLRLLYSSMTFNQLCWSPFLQSRLRSLFPHRSTTTYTHSARVSIESLKSAQRCCCHRCWTISSSSSFCIASLPPPPPSVIQGDVSNGDRDRRRNIPVIAQHGWKH